MRYTPMPLLVLAGLSNALPMPQLSLPSFGFGSGSSKSGGLGSGLGSGLRLPSLGFPVPTGDAGMGSGLSSGLNPKLSVPSLPTATGGTGSKVGDGGIGIPTSATDLPSTALATATPATAAKPTSTGAVGPNCTPQSSKGGSSENGIKDKNCCTDVTVIFARGTGEFGNMGTVSGPPMVKALREKLSADKVTVQGVDYPADAAGNANLGASGGPTMASLVTATKSQCPSSRIILSGYSQGAMVVHNAFKQGLSSSDVAGAVLFGDPLKRQAVGDLGETKTKQFCASGDTICGGGNDLQGTHLSYGSVGGEAAEWIVGVVGAS